MRLLELTDLSKRWHRFPKRARFYFRKKEYRTLLSHLWHWEYRFFASYSCGDLVVRSIAEAIRDGLLVPVVPKRKSAPWRSMAVKG